MARGGCRPPPAAAGLIAHPAKITWGSSRAGLPGSVHRNVPDGNRIQFSRCCPGRLPFVCIQYTAALFCCRKFYGKICRLLNGKNVCPSSAFSIPRLHFAAVDFTEVFRRTRIGGRKCSPAGWLCSFPGSEAPKPVRGPVFPLKNSPGGNFVGLGCCRLKNRPRKAGFASFARWCRLPQAGRRFDRMQAGRRLQKKSCRFRKNSVE